MQFINNLKPRGRQIFIGLITAFIVLPIFYFAYQASNNSDPNKQGTYYDKNSGQTVTNNNQTPETYGVESARPTYLGTTQLFDIGVTKYQLLAIEEALYLFAKKQTAKPSEISVDVKSIAEVSYDPEAANPVNQTSFIFQLDRKTNYKVTLWYSGLGTAKISVETLKGEQLYASPELDGTKISE